MSAEKAEETVGLPRPLPKTSAASGTRLGRRIQIAIGDPLVGWAMHPAYQRLATFLPPAPAFLRRGYAPPLGAWNPPSTDTPPELRGVAGIRRDPDEEKRVFGEDGPVPSFLLAHPIAIGWLLRRLWATIYPIVGPYHRARRASMETATAAPAAARSAHSPQRLAELVKEEGVRLGVSAVGIAPYDEKYTFAEHQGKLDTGSVIVCLLEQNFEATQSACSLRAERAALAAYVDVMEQATGIATMLHGVGIRAEAHTIDSAIISIHYGVQAGLGQLGLNGQLLSPQAGSRCRIAVITTNADIAHDAPVDYGVEAICDACQVCAKRCPTGAIPIRRKPSRGVMKAKINSRRCLPMVAQADGCAVCMKTCPVQRYGLDRVKKTYLETGAILGKGTDELEGYHWPLDEHFYGVGTKPKIGGTNLIDPPGWAFDAPDAAAHRKKG